MMSAAADVINHNDAKSVDSNLYDFVMQGWRRLNSGADVITGLSRHHPCRFSKGYISLSTRHWYLSFLYSSKSVKNYIYAKIQAEIRMFTKQNRQGLNQPILHPLWLMTSAAADVISVRGVHMASLGYNKLTLNLRGPCYLSLTRSISWLLMPWLLLSPGHQQPWYWLCRIGRSMSCLRKDSNYLCHINVEEWYKMWIYVSSEKFST